MYVIVHSSQALASAQIEALVSGHPRDAKKVSVIGAGRLSECPLRELPLYPSLINLVI